MRGDEARAQALAQRRRRRRFLRHAALTLIVDGVFVAIWALTKLEPAGAPADGGLEGFWPGWIMLLTAIPLGLHAMVALTGGPIESSQTTPGRRSDRSASPGRSLATVLFTDIAGSTERARAVGDRRWREVLDLHDRAVARAMERHRGRLVKNTGDGVLATFDGPGRAIECAMSLREEVRRLGLEQRAGLHTGEVELRGEDVGGIAVNIGARVMGEAGPGDVLVSSTVKDLVVGSGIRFANRGTFDLKGVPDRWGLFTVEGRDL